MTLAPLLANARLLPRNRAPHTVDKAAHFTLATGSKERVFLKVRFKGSSGLSRDVCAPGADAQKQMAPAVKQVEQDASHDARGQLNATHRACNM